MATFVQIAAKELANYGVTVNAIVPIANTRLTAGVDTEVNEQESPAHIAPMIAWLASPASRAVTGRVFNVAGGHVSVVDGWAAQGGSDKPGRWTVDELAQIVPDLVAKAAPAPDLRGFRPSDAGTPR